MGRSAKEDEILDVAARLGVDAVVAQRAVDLLKEAEEIGRSATVEVSLKVWPDGRREEVYSLTTDAEGVGRRTALLRSVSLAELKEQATLLGCERWLMQHRIDEEVQRAEGERVQAIKQQAAAIEDPAPSTLDRILMAAGFRRTT